MPETIYLDGKVTKRSLPVVHNPPPDGADGPKRLFLPQGELANFYDEDEGARYMALVELRVDGVRGNHVHRIKEEQVYLVSGQLLLVAQAGDESKKVSIKLEPGDLVKIAPGVAHAFKPLQAGYAVEFSKTRFNPSDSQRVALI